MASKTTTYQGSCHCGAVAFQVRVRTHKLLNCNCSICVKKGYLHLIVPREDFSLIRGREHLLTYTFNTHVAQHHFCSRCGVGSFYIPRSHPDAVDVNGRCLDDASLHEFQIEPFDGQNWESAVGQIRP